MPSLDGFQPVKVVGMVQHHLGRKVVRLAADLEGCLLPELLSELLHLLLNLLLHLLRLLLHLLRLLLHLL